jgi:hypothetical protein
LSALIGVLLTLGAVPPYAQSTLIANASVSSDGTTVFIKGSSFATTTSFNVGSRRQLGRYNRVVHGGGRPTSSTSGIAPTAIAAAGLIVSVRLGLVVEETVLASDRMGTSALVDTVSLPSSTGSTRITAKVRRGVRERQDWE